MKTEYVRDFKRNYLVICDEQVLTDNYEYKMMTKNDVSGLLRCSERMINGIGYLYYDITSKHAFSQFYADTVINMDTIKKLFSAIERICVQMEKYLLYTDGLHLEPEYIFVNADNEEYIFLYYKNEEETGGDLRELINFLMERIDSNDLKATEAVYQMADMVMRSCYSLDEILRWFDEEFCRKEMAKEDSYLPPIQYSTQQLDRIPKENINETKSKTGKKKKSLFGLIKSYFMGKEEEDDDEDYYEDYSENEVFEEEIPEEDNKTIYIPWIENCENKLYGVGKNNKLHIDLTRVPLTIGKLKGHVDIVIEDDSISRIHAKLTRESNRFFLSDQNSTNGTYRNGLRLNPNQTVPIEPGDEIALGKLKFIYR